MRSAPRPLACVLALAATLALVRAVAVPATAAGEASETIAATLMPPEQAIGGGTSVAGRLQGSGAGGAVVEAQLEPYPFHAFASAARATTLADGSFAFTGLHLDRNTRVRVVLPSRPGVESPTLLAVVDPTHALGAHDLGPGATQLSLRLRHTTSVRADPVPAHWYVSVHGGPFREAGVGATRELSPGLTYASLVLNPPARRFAYRVCVNPTWEHAMGPRSSHGTCPRALSYQGTASGTPLAVFPSAGAIAATAGFLDGRAGRTSLAVLDSSGHVHGIRLHEHFETASVVKVMMLTAYLQMLAAEHRGLSSYDTAVLYPMIHISDNEAASTALARVGAGALARVAREAGMSDYAPGVGWWAFTQTSAIDQVRLMAALSRLIPHRFFWYARYLLSTIEPSQSWGIPPVGRPRGWQVFFKTGALPAQGLFNEVALLERGPVTFAVAVFSDGDPSMAYGEETIEGVGSALLARAP